MSVGRRQRAAMRARPFTERSKRTSPRSIPEALNGTCRVRCTASVAFAGRGPSVEGSSKEPGITPPGVLERAPHGRAVRRGHVDVDDVPRPAGLPALVRAPLHDRADPGVEIDAVGQLGVADAHLLGTRRGIGLEREPVELPRAGVSNTYRAGAGEIAGGVARRVEHAEDQGAHVRERAGRERHLGALGLHRHVARVEELDGAERADAARRLVVGGGREDHAAAGGGEDERLPDGALGELGIHRGREAHKLRQHVRDRPRPSTPALGGAASSSSPGVAVEAASRLRLIAR